MHQTYLAAVGDANDIRTWSGIPFHLLAEARRQGVIDVGLPLSTDGWRWLGRRYAWNLISLLGINGPGGYQYSIPFLERLWSTWRSRLGGCRVINCFQLYPPSLVADATVERWYFLDQTLLQLFDTYGIRKTIGRRIAAEALRRERLGYQRATGIVMHSRWAADSVIEDYGIAADRVHVVVPGANLDSAGYARWEADYNPASREQDGTLRLVFVGKHPQRKGLDRLIRALRMARDRGADCTLRIIGCQPADLPHALRDVPGVEWVGFIDKRRDPVRYLDAVASCDVGCLLSRAEAGGIGLREYHALGLAVIGPEVGGSPDHVIPGAAWMVKPEASDGEVANLILKLAHDPAGVMSQRLLSWTRRQEVSWTATVSQMATLFAASSDEGAR